MRISQIHIHFSVKERVIFFKRGVKERLNPKEEIKLKFD
jgi:hypothetical protein